MKIYREIENGVTGAKDYKLVTGRKEVLLVAASLIAQYNIADSKVDDVILPSEIIKAIANATMGEILIKTVRNDLLK